MTLKKDYGPCTFLGIEDTVHYMTSDLWSAWSFRAGVLVQPLAGSVAHDDHLRLKPLA